MTELESLKQLADNKGISYHPSIGLEKLQEKIDEFDAQFETAKEAPKKTSKKEVIRKLKKENEKLVRVRIMCMNPQKKEWQGQYFTVGNAEIGRYTKYILFDHEYHINEFMRKNIEAKEFRTSKLVPDGKGGKVRKNIIAKEFNVEVLPPLTEAELDALRKDQLARNAIGD